MEFFGHFHADHQLTRARIKFKIHQLIWQGTIKFCQKHVSWIRRGFILLCSYAFRYAKMYEKDKQVLMNVAHYHHHHWSVCSEHLITSELLNPRPQPLLCFGDHLPSHSYQILTEKVKGQEAWREPKQFWYGRRPTMHSSVWARRNTVKKTAEALFYLYTYSIRLCNVCLWCYFLKGCSQLWLENLCHLYYWETVEWKFLCNLLVISSLTKRMTTQNQSKQWSSYVL